MVNPMLHPAESAMASPRAPAVDGLAGYAQREWKANVQWLNAEIDRWRTPGKAGPPEPRQAEDPSSPSVPDPGSRFAAWRHSRRLRREARSTDASWAPMVRVVSTLPVVR